MKEQSRIQLVAFSMLMAFAFLTGCASVESRVAEGQPYTGQINWPEDYTPEDSTFFVHNRIEIAAPPEVVWEDLIRAEEWPTWYEGASNVKVVSNEQGILTEDAVFTWRTMDLNFTSTIEEFEAPYRLSWESKIPAIRGYHAWLIVPTETGSIVVTDESQFGILAVLQGIFIPDTLHELHDIWLAELRDRSEARWATMNATSEG